MTQHPKAILFGSVGSLIESSEMQRESFNQAFDEAGLDWKWENEPYREMLKKCGGEKRIVEYARSRGETVDAKAIHDRKTEIFNEKLLASGKGLRPGVDQVIDYARDNNIKLGFVSSTEPRNIDSMMQAMEPALSREDFSVITSRELVSEGKPSPEVYEFALNQLGVSADEVVAIEDSSPSLQSAANAGVRCVAFPGYNCREQDYSLASHVAGDSLSLDMISSREALPA